MVSHKFFYFIKRFFEMGPSTALWLMRMRVKKRLFVWRWKKKIVCRDKKHQNGSLSATIHASSRRVTPAEAGAQVKLRLGHGLDPGLRRDDINDCHRHNAYKKAQKTFCSRIFADPEFQQSLPPHLHDKKIIYALADMITENKISILGFGTFDLSPLENNWHRDVTTKTPSPDAWRFAFYTDVTIPSSAKTSPSPEAHLPDIKVPWEISRFGHLFTLGRGYQQACQAGDTVRSTRYTQTFQNQITNWQTHNPFLIGVNWANPMEVAIRSINFIWAHFFFSTDQTIQKPFWHTYSAMLCEHQKYLEHNAEVSDKPNNHYLADLCGALYLTTFLSDTKKIYLARSHVLKNLIKQFEHQILPDHTCYEGSTNYHRLVTEMLMHTILLCKHTDTPLPETLHQHYAGMKQFLADCTDEGGNLVQIGDNDGGVIVACHSRGGGNPACPTKLRAKRERSRDLQKKPLAQFVLDPRLRGGDIKKAFSLFAQTNYHLTTYPHFGLSILTPPRWHITLRHPTYQRHQPTGHFHNDQLSITVSIDGMPLLVDPGTYRYTSDAPMRNSLRDFPAHNTFFAEAQAHAPTLDNNLFVLEHPIHAPPITTNVIHDWYQPTILAPQQLHRLLTFDQAKQTLTVIDWVEHNALKETAIMWTLNFAPTWEIQNESTNSWLIKRENKIYAVIKTTQSFEKIERFFSPTYGSLVPATRLEACAQTNGPEKLLIQLVS